MERVAEVSIPNPPSAAAVPHRPRGATAAAGVKDDSKSVLRLFGYQVELQRL